MTYSNETLLKVAKIAEMITSSALLLESVPEYAEEGRAICHDLMVAITMFNLDCAEARATGVIEAAVMDDIEKLAFRVTDALYRMNRR